MTPEAWTTLSKVSFVWNCHADHEVMAGKESREPNFYGWEGRSRVDYFNSFFLFLIGHTFSSLTSLSKPRGQHRNSP